MIAGYVCLEDLLDTAESERAQLEWGWNAHAVTYYVSTKVGQRGTRFLVGGGGWWLVVGGWWLVVYSESSMPR